MPTKKNRRMRLPNGFGRITEIKGKKLRKPFRAMISDGKDENGRPIGRLLKPVSYFETYNEAYAALMEHSKNPYDYSNTMTMLDLYKKWSEKHFQKVSKSRRMCIEGAWQYCTPLYDIFVRDLRTRDIKYVLENGERTISGKKRTPSDKTRLDMKSTLSQMLDYAVEYEMLSHNFVKDIKLETNTIAASPHKAFSESEIELLKASADDEVVQMILIQCYTGLRPIELCTLMVSSINMTEWYAVCGVKTKAGINRTVPIHKSIREYVSGFYTDAILNGRNELLAINGEKVTYHMYSQKFNSVMLSLNMQGHRPHDCRKHFITMAKKAGVDEYAIKRIVGHTITDITEAVYTERDAKWLHQELSKIP